MPRVTRETRPREWTRKEAKEYFDWLMAIKPERMKQIIEFSGASEQSSREVQLAAISATLRRSLGNLADESSGDQRVNGLGFIAGFDAALVVGEHLVQAVPDASWRTHFTSIKTQITRNLTVVQRGSSLLVFEPIFEGRMALSLIGRSRDKDVDELSAIYESWTTKLKLNITK